MECTLIEFGHFWWKISRKAGYKGVPESAHLYFLPTFYHICQIQATYPVVTVQPCIFLPAYRGQEACGVCLMKISGKKRL